MVDASLVHTYIHISSIRKVFLDNKIYHEDDRRDTFIEWPIEFIKPEDLAANGFFYLRQYDDVECNFCNGILGDWEEGQIPEVRHKETYPHCKFIRGLPVGNIPSHPGKIIIINPMDIQTEIYTTESSESK